MYLIKELVEVNTQPLKGSISPIWGPSLISVLILFHVLVWTTLNTYSVLYSLSRVDP